MGIGEQASIQQGGDSSETFGSALPPPLTRIDLPPHHAAAEGDERSHKQ